MELSPMELLAGEAAAQAMQPAPLPASAQSSEQRWGRAQREKVAITRHRTIRSCTECRLHKRKCDRARPICQHCIDTGRRERCRFVEGRARRGQQGDAASSSSTSLATPPKHNVPPSSPPSVHRQPFPPSLPVGRGSPECQPRSGSSVPEGPALHSSLARLRYEALDQVLADHRDLVLPSIDELDALLVLYRGGLEPFLRCAMADLNAPRYERCLRWWHGLRSSAQEREDGGGVAPPDPTSFTLMLVVLALGLQIGQASGLDVAGIANCSPQRKLIRVAGDCVDALQAALPPTWATAFVVPLDLVKATVLRGRWFLSQLQLQMARSCYTSAVHLACATGLHRDGHHWPTMRPEEAESRRQLWWCVMSEYLAAQRLDTSTILLPAMTVVDAMLPTWMQAIELQFGHAHETYPESLLLRRREPLQCDPIEFGYHVAHSRWVELRLQRTTWKGNEGRRLSSDHVADLERRQDELAMHLTPAALQWSEEDDDGLLRFAVFDPTDPSLDQRHFVERATLHLEHNLARLELHMPSIVRRDAQPDGGVGHHKNHESSLQRCLGAAQALVALVASLLPARPPPVLVEPLLHGALLAGMVLAVALGLRTDDTSETTALLVRPLLRRLLRALASKEGETITTTPRSVTEYAGKVHRFLLGMTGLTPTAVAANPRPVTTERPFVSPSLSTSTTRRPVGEAMSGSVLGPSSTLSSSVIDTSGWSLFSMTTDSPFAAAGSSHQSDSDSSLVDNVSSGDFWRAWQAICSGQVLLEDV